VKLRPRSNGKESLKEEKDDARKTELLFVMFCSDDEISLQTVENEKSH